MSDRSMLSAILFTRGFDTDDADQFVARLNDQQVVEDLRWHDWEQQQLSSGPPSSWSPDVQRQVSEHYLGPAHRVSPGWFLDLVSRENAAAGQGLAHQPPAQGMSSTTIAVGVGVLALAAVVGWQLSKR